MNLDDFKHPIIIPIPFLDQRKAIYSVLSDETVLSLGGSQSNQMLALDFCSADKQAFLKQIPSQHSSEHEFSFFHLGLVGIVPFQYEEEFDSSSLEVFEVRAAILWDCHQKKCSLVYSRNLSPEKWQKVRQKLAEIQRKVEALNLTENQITSDICLQPDEADELYLSKVDECVRDIRNGRFYQLNLLRYFSISEFYTDRQLAELFFQNGGPYSSLLQTSTLRLISFSPEQFVQMNWNHSGSKISMQPIKGTAARNSNPIEDQNRLHTLMHSEKDLAELSIIIDLARNDLNAVCNRGSVKVPDGIQAASFPTVHHLFADVVGNLDSSLNFEKLFSKLLPSASITGAPKKEVVQAILEREQRRRGFFMGNLFSWDPGSGLFDSSVLIRTVLGDRSSSGDWNYTYAAGSGLVVDSDSSAEMEEVSTKTNVLNFSKNKLESHI